MKHRILLLAALPFLWTACTNNDEPGVAAIEGNNDYTPIVMTEAETRMAAQSTGFAFRLLQAADAHLDQVFLSPLGATYALSMAAGGAAGDTYQELAEVLGFSDFSIDEIDAYNQKLLNEMSGLDQSATLAVANSLWTFDDFQVLDAYRHTLAQHYGAEAFQVDKAGAGEAINAWCAQETNGLISQFMPPSSVDSHAMLLDALYFKGAWSMPFDPARTVSAPFANAGGSTGTVKMMQDTRLCAYVADDLFEMACLPYGNGAFRLYVLLPAEGAGLSQCIASLDDARWEALQARMLLANLELKLPKFEVDAQNSLTTSLQALGIEKAFGTEADFSNLAQEDLFITAVDQAIAFRLDEEGAEASATTSVEFGELSPGNPEGEITIPFHVDRPFLFVLAEKGTGSILFMGKVTEL